MSNTIDWSSLGFQYMKTDYRWVQKWSKGVWEDGYLSEDAEVKINECAGVLQYSQTGFEGLKVYRTKDNNVVAFRPDLNA